MLFCSILDAVDRVVCEFFPLMPSYTGVSAICDDLQVTSDPQLALLVSEVIQRKFMESGRWSLNLKKCRILVHPDSAHLVVWPPRWRPGICAAIPIETDGAKLLGAPIGAELFRTDFVAHRVSKPTASVVALKRLRGMCCRVGQLDLLVSHRLHSISPADRTTPLAPIWQPNGMPTLS